VRYVETHVEQNRRLEPKSSGARIIATNSHEGPPRDSTTPEENKSAATRYSTAIDLNTSKIIS
jgi:hypothetical protein